MAASEMPAWSKLRRFAHQGHNAMDGMTPPRLASMPPGSQPDRPLPREAGLGQGSGAALAQHRTGGHVRRNGLERSGPAEHRQGDRVSDGVVVVAAVQQYLNSADWPLVTETDG